MKASRANELRSIIALALLCGGAHARAQSPPVALAIPQAPAPATAKNSASNGATVVGVRIVTQEGKGLSEAPANLAGLPGKPLEPNQVAESIRQLYRTGN